MFPIGINEMAFLLTGLKWTLALTVIGFVGGIIFGLIIALARVAKNRFIRNFSMVWIAVFQGTPMLMQLFVFYFGLPLIGLNLSSWLAISISLTAHASAFLGEIWRGAIQAIPKGQSEAAHALGLHYQHTMFDVVLPQALRISLPATVGFMVQLLKGTSLAAIVGFIELTRTGQILSGQIYKPLLVYAIIGVLYFFMCWPLSYFARQMELRLANKH